MSFRSSLLFSAELREHLPPHRVGRHLPSLDSLVDQSLLRKQARMELLLQGAELLPAHLPEAREADAAEGDVDDLEELLGYLLGR